MGTFLIRWAITAGAVAVATWLVPGIYAAEPRRLLAIIVVALVLGLVNAVIRPIVSLVACGCIILTLGLFTLVINAFMLWLAAVITQAVGLGFYVEGFWDAVLGGLIISVVSFIATTFVGRGRLGKRR